MYSDFGRCRLATLPFAAAFLKFGDEGEHLAVLHEGSLQILRTDTGFTAVQHFELGSPLAHAANYSIDFSDGCLCIAYGDDEAHYVTLKEEDSIWQSRTVVPALFDAWEQRNSVGERKSSLRNWRANTFCTAVDECKGVDWENEECEWAFARKQGHVFRYSGKWANMDFEQTGKSSGKQQIWQLSDCPRKLYFTPSRVLVAECATMIVWGGSV